MAEIKQETAGSLLTCLDLFCGCGGFTLGLERAGFRCLAAIDFNVEAVATFKANFGKGTLALHKDLTKFSPAKLAAQLGVNSVDVIVGGPPCQRFSTVRQVDSANHGSRVRKDKRRYFNPSTGSFKHGAGSSSRGAPRRLAALLNQLDLTWYLYGMTADEVLNLLPKEFDRFRNAA